MEALLHATKYVDVECCNLLRHGADLIGVIPKCGIGEPVAEQEVPSVDDLRNGCSESNRLLLRQLRSGVHDQWLLDNTQADADLGRMSQPSVVDEATCSSLLLQPRFAVQQTKPDGS
eukprot:6852217-Karenia_brevis.AAC.1